MTRLKKAWRVGTQKCLYLAVKKKKERKKLLQHRDSQFCEKSCVTLLEGSQLTEPRGEMKAFVAGKSC